MLNQWYRFRALWLWIFAWPSQKTEQMLHLEFSYLVNYVTLIFHINMVKKCIFMYVTTFIAVTCHQNLIFHKRRAFMLTLRYVYLCVISMLIIYVDPEVCIPVCYINGHHLSLLLWAVISFFKFFEKCWYFGWY